MAKSYDVVVVGAGPGGYVAAIRARQLGLTAAIIEKQWWGGVCLNVGCIPSKALLHNAHLAHTVLHRAKDFGLVVEGTVTADYGAAFRRSRTVADGRTKGVGFLMKKNEIDRYDGWATFTGPKSISVALNNGEHEELEAKNVIIATGARATTLPGTVLSERVVTYLEMIMRDTLPKEIVIIGAGAIGCEFAYVLNAYGSKVTMLEYLPTMLPLEDEDTSKEMGRQYKKLGIEVIAGAKVTAVEEDADGVTVRYEKDGAAASVRADMALQALGWAPRVEDYGLEKTGVELSARGWITVDDYMRTNVPGVFAIGDVTGRLQLAHVASAQALVAVETMAGHATRPLDYLMIPRCTYTYPQVASFGYTEKQAREKGFDIEVSRFPMAASGKANALGEAQGFIKLVTDKKYGALLGGHLVGPDVTELLPELTLAQQYEITVEEIGRNVHAHPTLSEALMDVAHLAAGMGINI